MMPGLLSVLFLLVLPGFVVFLWALIDALRTPARVWEQAEQNQLVWVGVVIFVTFIGAILYLVIARPQLRRAQDASFA